MGNDNYKGEPIIIALMGPTGSGKTHFINTLTGRADEPSASTLKPDTQNVTPYTISHGGHHLVLVDTLGFDNSSRPDGEVIRTITEWLNKKYQDGVRLTGVIYFHRITDTYMPTAETHYKHLHLFGRQCGNMQLRRARLVTTMWDQVKNQATAEYRQMRLEKECWDKAIHSGAVAKRFDNTFDSAWGIVEDLIRLIQNEAADQQTRPSQVEADKAAGCFSAFFSAKRS